MLNEARVILRIEKNISNQFTILENKTGRGINLVAVDRTVPRLEFSCNIRWGDEHRTAVVFHEPVVDGEIGHFTWNPARIHEVQFIVLGILSVVDRRPTGLARDHSMSAESRRKDIP